MTVERMLGGFTRTEWLGFLGIATADDEKLAALAGLSWGGNALKVLRVNATENGWEFVATAALTDGDKGDITVSSTGAVWTIDNGAVTLAKMADMATASLIYRKTAGSGAPEVQTLATLKTDLGLTGTNSGDQTSIVGITGTKGQFDTACSDGDFLYTSTIDTDGTLAANSDSLVASQKAVRTYVGNAVAGLLDFKGDQDCSANPNYPAASKGDAYHVSVAGKIGGASGKSVDVGDMFIAKADNAGGTEAAVGTSWYVVEHNLVGALLAANNLSDLASSSTARTNLGLGTGDSPQFTALNLGHASDTTISRVSAGDIAVEGNAVYRAGGTDVPVADGGTGASTAAAAATNLGLGTGDSPQFTAVNIGHASDTTITRVSAGDVAIEGNQVYRVGGADVSVADGGTGRSTSTTAYGLIAAGTTATGAHQTLAAGATTEILVGGGSSALPVWTTATGSGSPVRATSPTLVTPALGVATATSLTPTSGAGVSPLTATGPNARIIVDNAGGGTNYFDGVQLNVRSFAGAAYCVIDVNGVAPLSTTTASAANVHQASSGSVLLRSTSSALYKQDVEDVDPAYATAILSLRPVWYRSKADADNPNWGWWGLLSEEVAKVDPRLVHWAYRDEDYWTTTRKVKIGKDADGNPVFVPIETRRLRKGAKLKPDGVQYERLSVLLLSLVKSHENRIAALEKRLGVKA